MYLNYSSSLNVPTVLIESNGSNIVHRASGRTGNQIGNNNKRYSVAKPTEKYQHMHMYLSQKCIVPKIDGNPKECAHDQLPEHISMNRWTFFYCRVVQYRFIVEAQNNSSIKLLGGYVIHILRRSSPYFHFINKISLWFHTWLCVAIVVDAIKTFRVFVPLSYA